MKKLHVSDINQQQLVDVRTQHDFQAGHLKGALNLIPRHFKHYGAHYLEKNQPLVFLVKDEEEVTELKQAASEEGYEQVEGYLLMDDVPAEKLETTETIPAEEFLKQEEFILLDVRHPDEITRPAPEKNLVNIPFEDLMEGYTSLDQKKPIYTLCGSGNRGTAAASFLQTKGLNPIVVDGGMKAIQEQSK